jgi:hypothetical protein
MKDLKVKLFDFKNGLKFEQSDVVNIVEAHMKDLNTTSEKRIILSLNEKLNVYSYDEDVQMLIESLEGDLRDYELLYDLKDLYKMVESKNNGMIYRHPLNVILDIINLDSDSDRMVKIMNELAINTWVPEIKLFIHNLTTSPEKRQNLTNGGTAHSVYTIVESIENGHLAFINDSWFSIQEDNIAKTLLEDHITDPEKLTLLRTLESALNFAQISEDRIDFNISESLTIGISLKKGDTMFINEDKVSKETTLENLFSSPIIPIVNKNFFPLIKETASNINKFVELDIVKHVSNITNPFLDSYIFNFGEDVYTYSCDERYGNSFFKYESATDLINDVRNSLSYDISYFFGDKLSEEVKTKTMLEDKVREIQIDLKNIDDNVDKVEANLVMLGESEVLSSALEMLKEEKASKEESLLAAKELLYKEVIKK